jgi:putative membrane protein
MSPMIASVLVALVALIQAAIAVVEMLFWKKPVVHRRLDYTEVEARKVAPIVANAGLYNGFLAAGLIWGVLLAKGGDPIKGFFLGCVIVAGLFGAVTLKSTTLILQAVPGAIALMAVWMSRVAP